MNSSSGCSSCLGMIVKYVGGMIVSSIVGWISGLVSSVLPGILASALGGDAFKELAGLLSIALGAIPFLVSMSLSLVTGLLFRRRQRAAA
jgi:hypothetical protein